MAIYTYNNFVSDLNQFESVYNNGYRTDAGCFLDALDQKIASNYTKSQFRSDVVSLFKAPDKYKHISRMYDKLQLVSRQKSILYLSKKCLDGDFFCFPHHLIHWDYNEVYSQFESFRSHFQSLFEQDMQKVIGYAREVEGYRPTLYTIAAGAIGASWLFSSTLVPSLVTGVAVAALSKLYSIYRGLGDPPAPPVRPPQPKPEPGLRFRIRRT